MSKTQPAANPVSPSLIHDTPILHAGSRAGSIPLVEIVPAVGISAALHVLIVAGFVLMLVVNPTPVDANPKIGPVMLGDDEQDAKDKKNRDDSDDPFDPTDDLLGKNRESPFPSNDSTKLADVNIAGPTNPLVLPGTGNGPLDVPARSMSPPPGAIDVKGSATFGIVSGLDKAELNMLPHLNPGDIGARLSGATRAHLLDRDGGNAASEVAVARGLRWLANHQSREGYFALDNFHEHAQSGDNGKDGSTRCNCEGEGLHDNVAGTAFALLCFLGAGLTPDNAKHQEYDYSKQIDRGLQWLKSNQGPDGRFFDRSLRQENPQLAMYDHAIATICMCEAASLYPQTWVKRSAQQALDFLVKVQDRNGGGWRYGASPQAGDTSVVGWCVMALQSGRMAGLTIPKAAFDKVAHYFDGCELETTDGVFYGYIGTAKANGDATMTSVGVLSRMYLGWKRDDPKLTKAVSWLGKNAAPDPAEPTDMYRHYYATQVMHHMGGDAWNAWNPKMRDLLIARQDRGDTKGKPHQLGSWSPSGDPWCRIGGRVMMTALCVLTLEVYYRHLPLYRAEFER